MKRLAILTSGGDAPGMNAAIRAAVRLASSRGIEPIGVMHGYQGLLNDDTVVLNPRSVSNTVQRGGTILKTSRCSEFESEAGRERAKKTLERRNIDGLIVIGGNGTLTGAIELGRIWRGQIIGLPGTIDNDLAGSDFTIGYDTAVTTALYGIDRIRDTAESHERVFLIEVMGRHAGFIALDVAIAGGAEEVLLPEVKT
ncbi:MAG TPA: ATP-dependent 6-phosphofructokinase, partial [Oligoflexia bacterium]|nr:ATP-dependent 6-phosphofructokinase [Oligoflexia bacterium]